MNITKVTFELSQCGPLQAVSTRAIMTVINVMRNIGGKIGRFSH
jgi:hypothetical protein